MLEWFHASTQANAMMHRTIRRTRIAAWRRVGVTPKRKAGGCCKGRSFAKGLLVAKRVLLQSEVSCCKGRSLVAKRGLLRQSSAKGGLLLPRGASYTRATRGSSAWSWSTWSKKSSSVCLAELELVLESYPCPAARAPVPPLGFRRPSPFLALPLRPAPH